MNYQSALQDLQPYEVHWSNAYRLELDGDFAAENMRADRRSSSVLVDYSARLMRYCRPLAKGVGIYHYQLGSAEGRR